MKKAKYIFQSLIFILEISIIVGGLTYITNYFYPIYTNIEFFERFILFLTFYQLFVYSTLKLKDDAHKDSLNTVKSYYEITLLYFEIINTDPIVAKEFCDVIKRHINLINNKSVFNSEEVIKYYNDLKIYIDDNNVIMIKFNLININAGLTHLELEFMHSFFLRYLKSKLPSHVKEYMENNEAFK